MAVDNLLKRDIVEVIIPVNTNPPAWTSGVSGAWTSWVQVISNTAVTFPFILCGAHLTEGLSTTTTGSVLGHYTLQIGTGAAASEVVIAETSGIVLVSSTPQVDTTTYIISGTTKWFEPVIIPGSTRIAARSSATSATGVSIALYLVGYNATTFGLPLRYIRDWQRYIKGLMAPTQGTVSYPSPGATSVTCNTFATGYGAWVEFIASASKPTLIVGLSGGATSTSGRNQAQIGIGAASSEVVHSKVGLAGRAVWPGPLASSYLPRPLFVKPGERVAVNGTGAASTIDVSLMGFELL